MRLGHLTSGDAAGDDRAAGVQLAVDYVHAELENFTI